MSTLKQRLHRKNASGTYDTIHLETSADCITGTLGVANGGTGRATLTSGYFLRGNGTGAITMSSIDQVKSALGIGGGGSITDPPVAPVSIPNVSGTLFWAGKTWIVVHKVTGIAFLGLNTLEGTVQFSASSVNDYLGSKLHDKALDYAVQLKLYACDYVLDYMGGKVFVASYDQLNGDFSYFTDNSKRNLGQTYWTSSGRSSSEYVWCVNVDGGFYSNRSSVPTTMIGFRPFIALRT